MDYEEVIKIFGETDDCSGALGIKSCKWGNDEKYVKVNFAAGKVVMFSSYGL